MAPFTPFVRRLLAVGGLAVAASAGPLMAGLTAPAGPASPALASCPSTEILDPTTGACKPVTDQTAPTFNPIEPGAKNLQPGEITSGAPGDVGEIPKVNGIPCTGSNTGLCIGLEGQNAGEAAVPKEPAGVQG
jgi:hypothetical protein